MSINGKVKCEMLNEVTWQTDENVKEHNVHLYAEIAGLNKQIDELKKKVKNIREYVQTMDEYFA